MAARPSFCREEATRTPDPHVPNVVRYQLRYFSFALLIFSKAGAKVLLFFDIRKLFAIYFTLFRRKECLEGFNGSVFAVISRASASVSADRSVPFAIG